MIYLATPYTAATAKLQHENYLKAIRSRLEIMKLFQIPAYSPIVENHETAKIGELPTDAKYWESRNNHFIDLSEGLILDYDYFTEEQYNNSAGCQSEIGYARSTGKNVWIRENNSLNLINTGY